MATKKPTTSALTTLLQRFGISYNKAPAPTPALLAYMRGIGMTLDTAEDTRDTAMARLKTSRTDALGDINRTAARTKQNVTGDLIGRGVLRSGEASDRYSRHAADVADRRSGVQATYAEGVEGVTSAFQTSRDQLRQTALERVLGTETEQAQQKASLKAQEAAIKAQQEASNRAFAQQQAAQENYVKSMEQLYKQYGA